MTTKPVSFMETEINASSERRINKPRIGRYLADLKIWNLRMQKKS